MDKHIIPVVMPRWGMEMSEGEIVSLYVEEGLAVKAGETLFDVQTAKVTNSVETIKDGQVRKLLVVPGDVKTCGSLLAVIASGEVLDKDIEEFTLSYGSHSQQRVSPKEHPKDSGASQNMASNASSQQLDVSPPVRKLANKLEIDLGNIVGTGRGGKITAVDVKAAYQAEGRTGAEKNHKNTALTNRSDHRIDIADSEYPVVSRSSNRNQVLQKPIDQKELHQDIALSSMRKYIADKMTLSKTTAPHYRLVIDIRMDAVNRQKQLLNADLGISVSDFILKAISQALLANKSMNGHFLDDKIRLFRVVNLAFAVALPEGIVTPVIKNIQSLSLAEIAAHRKYLTDRARTNILKQEEMETATFTVSNLGPMGVKQFDAVIPLPQIGILAIGISEKRPILREDNLIFATLMTVSLSCDHRAIDGAMAAAFLGSLKSGLESPTRLVDC